MAERAFPRVPTLRSSSVARRAQLSSSPTRRLRKTAVTLPEIRDTAQTIHRVLPAKESRCVWRESSAGLCGPIRAERRAGRQVQRKFSTSIMSLLRWSSWVYRIHLSSGDTAIPGTNGTGLSVQRGNMHHPFLRKAQKLESRLRASFGVHEVNAVLHQSPVAPKATFGKIQHRCFIAAVYRNAPETVDVSCLSRSTGISHPATRTRQIRPASLSGPPVRLRQALSRPPNAPCGWTRSRSIVHLSTSWGRHRGCVAGHAPRWAPIHADDMDTPVAIERDAAAVRRPPRSTDHGAAKRSQLNRIGTRRVAHPDLTAPCTVGSKRDSRAIG